MEAISSLIARIPTLKAKEKGKSAEELGKLDLMSRIKETHIRLNAMRSAFECETNFDLIDIYILEIDALERQYSYLIKQAKAQHVVAF